MKRKTLHRVAPPETESPEHSGRANELAIPVDWRKGSLLNVRNGGEEYIVTLHPEEYDPQHPTRCLRFTNVGECQSFISSWYSRESHDPRA